MGYFNDFENKHRELFAYRRSDEIHGHDHFLEHTILRLVPKWMTPNKITLFRVIGTPLVFFLVLFNYYLLGVFLFLFFSFTDVLDGSTARTRNQITRFGMLFDPLADKLLIGSMVLLLVFRYLNFWLGLAILGIEIIFIVSALVVVTRFKTVKMANLWGKVKMVLQVIAVCVILMALLFDYQELFLIATWLFGLAIGFAIISLFRHGV